MNATATHVKMVEHVLAWLMDTPVPVGLVTVGMTVKTVTFLLDNYHYRPQTKFGAR